MTIRDWRGFRHRQISEVNLATSTKGSSLCEVFLPCRIVRIRLTPDLDVPPDRRPTSMLQPHGRWFSVRVLPDAEERPVPSLVMAPVFLSNPAGALGRVFPACPLPETGEDGAIHFAEGPATHYVPMIVSPTTYFGVEGKDQFGGGFRQPRRVARTTEVYLCASNFTGAPPSSLLLA